MSFFWYWRRAWALAGSYPVVQSKTVSVPEGGGWAEFSIGRRERPRRLFVRALLVNVDEVFVVSILADDVEQLEEELPAALLDPLSPGNAHLHLPAKKTLRVAVSDKAIVGLSIDRVIERPFWPRLRATLRLFWSFWNTRKDDEGDDGP